jgi:sugar lactone lactonase YvrE
MSALGFAAMLATHTASAAPLALGDIVVTDFLLTPSVIRVDPVSGEQTTISSGGLLGNPNGVAVDDFGIVYVIDTGGKIVRVDPAAYDAGDPDANQELVAQGGLLTTPQDGDFDADGTLLVAAQAGSKLVRVDPSAFNALDPDANQTLVTSGDLLSSPKDVAVDRATGNAYVTSFSTDRVIRVAPNGTQTIAALGALLESPTGIAREADGHLVVRGDPNGIVRIDPDAYTGADPGANQEYVSVGGLLVLINDVAVEASGDVVATDGFGYSVSRIDPDAYSPADPDGNQTLVSPQDVFTLFTNPVAIDVYTPEPAAELLGAVALASLVRRRHTTKTSSSGLPSRRNSSGSPK